MNDIERLIIIESLRELKARYCRLADHKECDQLADLFTEDASVRFYDPRKSKGGGCWFLVRFQSVRCGSMRTLGLVPRSGCALRLRQT